MTLLNDCHFLLPILGTQATETRSLHQYLTQSFTGAGGHLTTYSSTSHTRTANVLSLLCYFWRESNRRLRIGQSVVSVCKAQLNHEGTWHEGTTIYKM